MTTTNKDQVSANFRMIPCETVHGDYIGETMASGANLSWIAGHSRNFAARLREAATYHAKAVLVVANPLFTENVLRPDKVRTGVS